MTVLSIVNGAIAGLPDPSRDIQELSECWEESNGDGGPYARDVTPIIDNNTAAGWVNAAMELYNQTLICVVHRGEQADGTACAQIPMRGCCSYLPLDVTLPPPAEDMIDDSGEESDDEGQTRRPNPRSFRPTKPGFRKFEMRL